MRFFLEQLALDARDVVIYFVNAAKKAFEALSAFCSEPMVKLAIVYAILYCIIFFV